MRAAMITVNLLVIWLSISAQTSAAPLPYRVTDLGAIDGYPRSVPFSINSRGQVVGHCYTPYIGPGQGNEHRAFVWSADTGMLPLPSLGGTSDVARCIADTGDIVGESNGHPCLWTNGQVVDLGTLSGSGLGGANSTATGVNDARVVVGYSIAATGSRHAFQWKDTNNGNGGADPGEMIDLNPVGVNESFATGINASGHIAGHFSAGSPSHARLWVDGAIRDLGPSYGIALNDYDTVVGDHLVDALANNYHPCLWRSSGEFVDLGLLAGTDSGMAESINNAEQVVGYLQGGSIGFLWENGTIYDLNDLLLDGEGWQLGTAYDINDFGQVVGVGTNPSGERHAYLLTPIPEPATLSLLAVGGLVALRRRR